MELIMMVNLAFSVVGFFFIYRMWREVKSRRDEYGENFNIPRGRDKTPKENCGSNTVDVAQLAALVAQNVREPEQVAEPEPEPLPALDEGDLQKIMAAVMAAQKGGA